jgi:glutathione S-transferase
MILISLDYSPWSEKARWALDHCGLNYSSKTYVSMVGAPWLRLKTKNLTEPVSVPVLINDREVLTDSFDIAVRADRNRIKHQDKTLFPCKEKAREWNILSETALSIGRYYCVLRQLSNTEAQKEILPSFIPCSLKPYFTWLARNGLQYHLKKYAVEQHDLAIYKDILSRLRAELDGKHYVLDEFSYCDIVMALALQYVKPVDHRYSAPGPAAAECWTNPELLEEFSDLIEWRDWIYQQHR